MKELIFPGLISLIVSWIVAWWQVRRTLDKQNEIRLNDKIFDMNRIAIEYLYSEDEDFCTNYGVDSADEKTIRYDIYCCIVFNLLEEMWEHFGGDKERIENYFSIKEMVLAHKKWWISINNTGSYKPDFKKYVSTYLK